MVVLSYNKAMNKSKILSVLQTQKPTLGERFGISRLGLFGSYAKDQAQADSDIDLVYELEPGKLLMLPDLIALEQLLSEELKHERVELVDLKYMNPIIRYYMKEEVIYV
jgi:predicted nucleotidyltransferase